MYNYTMAEPESAHNVSGSDSNLDALAITIIEAKNETSKLIQEVCKTNIEEIDVLFDLNQEDNLSAHNSISESYPDIYSRSKMPKEMGFIATSLRPTLTRIGMIAYYVMNNPEKKPPYTNGWDLSELEIIQIKASLDEKIIEIATAAIEDPKKIHTIPQEIQPEELITAIAYLKVKTIFEKISANDSDIVTVEATDID